MNSDRNGPPHEVDLLAPWRATGRLDAADAAALERMLADDPELAARLDFASEEREAAVDLNEALPTPSGRVRDDLFARIEAHEAARAPRSAGVMRWLSERLAGLSPATLAWGATAAALVIAVQAGLLTAGLFENDGARYETASAGGEAVAGPTALVAFQPAATADQIAALLREAGAEIVGGPKPGGVFVVRLSDRAMSAQERDAAMKRLGDASAVVRFVLPAGGGG